MLPPMHPVHLRCPAARVHARTLQPGASARPTRRPTPSPRPRRALRACASRSVLHMPGSDRRRRRSHAAVHTQISRGVRAGVGPAQSNLPNLPGASQPVSSHRVQASARDPSPRGREWWCAKRHEHPSCACAVVRLGGAGAHRHFPLPCDGVLLHRHVEHPLSPSVGHRGRAPVRGVHVHPHPCHHGVPRVGRQLHSCGAYRSHVVQCVCAPHAR